MDIRYFYVSDHIHNKTLSLKHCPTEEMLADYFTKPLQGALFVRLRNDIMGADFANGHSQNHRSVLDDDDDETPMEASDQDQEASEQNQTASATTTTASERQQVGSEHDQNAEHDQHENNSGPTLRDQNHENVCATNAAAQDHNDENVGDMKGTQDHNNKSVFRTNTRSGGKNRKQMTYREALVGLDNSDPGSDF